jgi:oxygen-independent coproporphyrinogen III oxidase
MAGIYIHIPFCRKVCYYCDFFFTVSMKQQERFLRCLKKEMMMQTDYLNGEVVDTIYFGGGTPSVLQTETIQELIELIQTHYQVSQNPEITMEANPDDLTVSYLDELADSQINRLSIGVQSFFDEHLAWMNRRHNGNEALQSIFNSKQSGFTNINADLIYGFRGLSNDQWKENLQILFEQGLTHISCYMMGIEPGSVFGIWMKKGKFPPVPDEVCIEQFQVLLEETSKAGYEHYEISNFCQPGHYSRHNTSYWFSKQYLGFGPSATSYNRHSRQWNVRSLEKYLSSIEQGIIPSEKEELTQETRYNDFILTSLRTRWGVNHEDISRHFGEKILAFFLEESSAEELRSYLLTDGKRVWLSPEGMIMSDHVISSLLIV